MCAMPAAVFRLPRWAALARGGPVARVPAALNAAIGVATGITGEGKEIVAHIGQRRVYIGMFRYACIDDRYRDAIAVGDIPGIADVGAPDGIGEMPLILG